MRKKFHDLTTAILLGLIIPVLGTMLIMGRGKPEKSEPPATVPDAPVQTEEKTSEKLPKVTIRNAEGEAREMELKDYLAGVVLAEMPADFEPEALKAQTVVSATYTLRRMEVRDKHDGAVCTDPGCCQAYRDPQAYLKAGGSREDLEKIQQAVADAAGQVLTYQGKLIEATFFSCTGGSTESAVEVWGGDVPYLQATPSPGEEIAVHFQDKLNFSREALEEKLDVSLPPDPADWFDRFTYTQGGGVDRVEIGGKLFSGLELRKKLGLRSTDFFVTPGDGEVILTTRGFGHRVGMSQYGAQAMALDGKTYDEILTHYYQGAELISISD